MTRNPGAIRTKTYICPDHNNVELKRGLRYARLVACVLVQLLRLVIGAVLLWFGSLYLIHTIEINELILNAVALEFVLRIDDILFVCFVPTRVRALIKQGKPLSAPSVLKTRDGLDIRSVLSFLVCLCLVLVLYFTELVPQKHILEQAQHAMCGGDLDFVYAKDPMGAAWWAPTKKQSDDLATLETTLLPRDRPTILDEISVSGGAATSRCPCGVRKRAGATAATRTAR